MKFLNAKVRSNIVLGAQVALFLIIGGGLTVGSADPGIFTRTADAAVIASHENDPTYKYAFEGHGDTCVLESWVYPAKYDGIQDWKNNEPEKAQPSYVEARPNDAGCDKNFNPANPAVALTGKDYGANFGTRFKDNYGEPQA
jgi:hypothetical protein